MKKQCGFTVIEIVLGLALIAVISAAGFFAYTNYRSSHTTVSNVTATPTASTATAKDPSQYLVIKEWNAKIKMRDAAKVSYSYIKADSTNASPNGEIPDSAIAFAVKPEYLKDRSCKVSVAWSRYSKIKSDFLLKSATKIGAYYFLSTGSPYNCDNDSDNALNERIRSDFAHLEAL